MTDLLPIVEQLAGYKTLPECADWLMRCPDGVIHRDHMAIRRILQRVGFMEGLAHLETRLSALNATRRADGSLPELVAFSVHLSANDMTIASRKARPS